MVKYKATQNNRSKISIIMIGSAVSLAITLLFSALITSLILNGAVDASNMCVMLYATIFLSVLVGSLVSCHMASGSYGVINIIIAGIYLFIIISTNIILFNGTFKRMWLTLIIVAAASLLTSILSVKGRGLKRNKKFKI